MNQNLGQLRREVITSTLITDQLAEVLERRVTALEEITAARWPRRILVRRRLARDLRASVAGYREAGPDFGPRRIQAVSDGWIEPLSGPSQTSLRCEPVLRARRTKVAPALVLRTDRTQFRLGSVGLATLQQVTCSRPSPIVTPL